ncbi:MAG TPA: 3-isopropylmalate dehydrogenase [Blastocatellia bacterium]|nr:3-isopropylmalate dehydrogenase [Blastocatellia bacterium]
MLINITVLPGDGIGPEVTSEAVRVLEAVSRRFNHELQLTYKEIGGRAIAESGDPLPPDSLRSCLESRAVLLGAVGHPDFERHPVHLRPEAGLLRLRKGLGGFANLRPAFLFPALIDASPLKPEVVRGTDMLIVRELLGGLYFGEPRGADYSGESRTAFNTMRYSEAEVERVARVALELAMLRRRRVTSVDKANVLESSQLWREVVIRVAAEYPAVTLDHQYVDSCAMALLARPASFDVIVTENLFGDILSDQAGAVVGSLGLLASATIGGRVGLYEPVHGSAPDIAGKGIANPLGAIMSVAMMLRYSFSLEVEAAAIEQAVNQTLKAGQVTPDLAARGAEPRNTRQVGTLIEEYVSAVEPT